MRLAVVQGFNSFIEEQSALPGDCKLTVMQFDDRGMDYLRVANDLQTVNPMRFDEFEPRGATPLYDAIGQLIGDIDARNAGLAAPEVMLFVIFTDGEDNASSTESKSTIRRKIEEHQGLGWTFTFLGANQNAYLAGDDLGVSKGSTSNFAPDAYGAAAAYSSVSANTSHLRSAVMKGVAPDPTQFYAGAGKGAEEDLARRPSQSPPPKVPQPEPSST